MEKYFIPQDKNLCYFYSEEIMKIVQLWTILLLFLYSVQVYGDLECDKSGNCKDGYGVSVSVNYNSEIYVRKGKWVNGNLYYGTEIYLSKEFREGIKNDKQYKKKMGEKYYNEVGAKYLSTEDLANCNKDRDACYEKLIYKYLTDIDRENNTISYYKGFFHNGKKNGEGEMVFWEKKGNKYYLKTFKGIWSMGFYQKGTSTTEGGDEYTGEFFYNNKRHGFGVSIMRQPNKEIKSILIGNWDRGKVNGKSLQKVESKRYGKFEQIPDERSLYIYYTEKVIYFGDWKNHKMDGIGYSIDWNFFEEKWKKNPNDWKGILTDFRNSFNSDTRVPKNVLFLGKYENGVLKQAIDYPLKDTPYKSAYYQGAIEKNKFNGEGEIIIEDSDSKFHKISGTMVNGTISRGLVFFRNQNYIYDGDIQNYKPSGKGTIKQGEIIKVDEVFFKDGIVESAKLKLHNNECYYIGEVNDNFIPHGKGKYGDKYTNKSSTNDVCNKENYEGSFVNGKKHGVNGKFSGSNYDFVGEFQDNQPVKGRISYHQEETIIGENLFGIRTEKNDVYSGIFLDTKRQDKNGEYRGHYFFYKGGYFDDKLHGEGTLILKNKFAVKGTFEQNTIKESNLYTFLEQRYCYLGNFKKAASNQSSIENYMSKGKKYYFKSLATITEDYNKVKCDPNADLYTKIVIVIDGKEISTEAIVPKKKEE